jgi:hypothetical protein
MYVNAVSDSVMLYLQHNFCNIIFKIKHKLYRASGTATYPPPPPPNSGCMPAGEVFNVFCSHIVIHVTVSSDLTQSLCVYLTQIITLLCCLSNIKKAFIIENFSRKTEPLSYHKEEDYCKNKPK